MGLGVYTARGLCPAGGLNNNIIFRGNSNYQQLTSNLKKIILCGNLRVICGNLRSDIFLRGNSNYQQLSSNLKIFLIAVILLASSSQAHQLRSVRSKEKREWQ